MLDFDIQRCTRRCAKSGDELKPGDNFYSVLIAEGNKVLRYDYAEGNWEGPPEQSLGWWKSQMPSANANRVNWAPNDVMLHYFQELEDQDGKQETRYVLALLMVRRRVVRLEDTETDDDGNELLVLFCPKTENEYKVQVVDPTEEKILEVQDELAQLLFANAS